MIEKVDMYCTVEVYCYCPYCDSLEDIFSEVKESMDRDHRVENVNMEVNCSQCSESFIGENVTF